MQSRLNDCGIGELPGKCIHGAGLSMHEKSPAHSLHIPAPSQEFRLVRMSGKAVDGVNVRTRRDLFAKDPDRARAINDLARQRASRRKSDEHDAGVRIGKIVPQVMPYAAAGTHAGACQYDGAAGYSIDCR